MWVEIDGPRYILACVINMAITWGRDNARCFTNIKVHQGRLRPFLMRLASQSLGQSPLASLLEEEATSLTKEFSRVEGSPSREGGFSCDAACRGLRWHVADRGVQVGKMGWE